MNLFKSELFNSVMSQEIHSRPQRSCGLSKGGAPAFGRRYGRRGATTTSNPAPFATLALALEVGAIEQVGDTFVLLDYDQAA